jgi:lysophospholipase L1-like esterase
MGRNLQVAAAFLLLVGCGSSGAGPGGESGPGTGTSTVATSAGASSAGPSSAGASSSGAASSGASRGSGTGAGAGTSTSTHAGAGDAGTADSGGTADAAGAHADAAGGKDAAPDGALPNITVWIAGDSTVASHNAASATSVESWGWGGQFEPLLDGKAAVTNSAIAGRSVRTWLYSVQSTADTTGECILDLDANGNPVLQARWTAMLAGMKTGDWLFVEFGINDGDTTCPRHVGSAAFIAAYAMMAQAARARGANPVFVTPTNGLNSCNFVSNRGFLAETETAGAQNGVPVIDLNALTIAYFKSIGCTATTAIFADGRTHFTQAGAMAIAGLVAQAVRDQGLSLAAYLR